jgi:hypothetical protein
VKASRANYHVTPSVPYHTFFPPSSHQFSNRLDSANARNACFLTHCQLLSRTIITDHPLTISISLLISFVYLICKFDFKIIMVTVIIIGRNDHKDGASFRKSFSVKEKRELVQAIELLMEEHKVNACQACLLIGVNQMYYTRFKRIIKKVDNTEFRDVFVPYKPNGSAWKIHPGGKSILNGVKEDLSYFVFETRQLSIQVSTRMV